MLKYCSPQLRRTPQVRGLKRNLCYNTIRESRTRRGAWIETSIVGTTHSSWVIVAPAGVIETTVRCGVTIRHVAYFAGAWIERSFRPYGRLFGIVDLAGVRIETFDGGHGFIFRSRRRCVD